MKLSLQLFLQPQGTNEAVYSSSYSHREPMKLSLQLFLQPQGTNEAVYSSSYSHREPMKLSLQLFLQPQGTNEAVYSSSYSHREPMKPSLQLFLQPQGTNETKSTTLHRKPHMQGAYMGSDQMPRHFTWWNSLRVMSNMTVFTTQDGQTDGQDERTRLITQAHTLLIWIKTESSAVDQNDNEA